MYKLGQTVLARERVREREREGGRERERGRKRERERTDIYAMFITNFFHRSLPSWRTLQPTDGQELNRTVCSEEEMRALNSKEAVILITNLSSDEAFIPQHEIITDVTQMRTVANVHESLVRISALFHTIYIK